MDLIAHHEDRSVVRHDRVVEGRLSNGQPEPFVAVVLILHLLRKLHQFGDEAAVIIAAFCLALTHFITNSNELEYKTNPV